MVDLTLNLLFCYYEASQPVVSPFFHALHSIEFTSPVAIRLQTFDKINFRVGTRAEHTNALEVLRLHIEVAISEWAATLPIPGHILAALSFLFL